MRRRAYGCLVVVLLALAANAGAQDAGFPWDPRSGDPWLDRQLADINVYAKRYPDAYADELVRYRAAPRALVTRLQQDRSWAPGDLYYACALAQMTVRPCTDVVAAWRRDHALGWQVVASGLGVAPATADARRLRQGIVDSYRRWSRPIVTDDAPPPARDARTRGAPR